MTEGTPEQAEVTSTLWSKMTRRQLTRSIPINYVQTADASFLAANLPSACCRCIIGVLSDDGSTGSSRGGRAEQRPTLLNDRVETIENGSKCRRYMNIFTFITFSRPMMMMGRVCELRAILLKMMS
ncbi:Nicotinate-nucleotide--dimethylbenzimidazole phosphoribosyltransferase [Trichinella spiralis]|uniref:Nicotinate-nucleotide--dimethylbenzimidazole phosphoribosyltransferase n=1 Tax=Trichinella spiralis TaxID=6334 RepID=A0ABR3KZZ4_TRISP